MVIFVVVSVAITCLNLLNQFGALLIALDPPTLMGVRRPAWVWVIPEGAVGQVSCVTGLDLSRVPGRMPG
jgi:hypothetical protein